MIALRRGEHLPDEFRAPLRALLCPVELPSRFWVQVLAVQQVQAAKHDDEHVGEIVEQVGPDLDVVLVVRHQGCAAAPGT